MKSLYLLAGMLVLMGCAVIPSDDDAVEVSPGIVFKLPTPAELGRRVEAVQLVTADYPGGSLVFEARIAVTPERLMLTGTDTLGQRLLTLVWDGDSVRIIERASWLPAHVRAQNILADVLMVAAPTSVVQRNLRGATVIVGTSASEIRTASGPAIKIERDGDGWSGHARIENLSRNYRLDVQSIEVSP